MHKFIISGIGPDIGKTLVSAILVNVLNAYYWKPIQCGNLEDSDTLTVQRLVPQASPRCLPEAYRLKHPLSPHHAAALEGITINTANISEPTANLPFIIECAGGLLVPLNKEKLQLDLYAEWNCSWILVSKHYLGSINQTLLSIEALKSRNINLIGIVFNGSPNPQTEEPILQRANVPMLGRLLPKLSINTQTIQHLANLWKQYSWIKNLVSMKSKS